MLYRCQCVCQVQLQRRLVYQWLNFRSALALSVFCSTLSAKDMGRTSFSQACQGLISMFACLLFFHHHLSCFPNGIDPMWHSILTVSAIGTAVRTVRTAVRRTVRTAVRRTVRAAEISLGYSAIFLFLFLLFS